MSVEMVCPFCRKRSKKSLRKVDGNDKKQEIWCDSCEKCLGSITDVDDYAVLEAKVMEIPEGKSLNILFE